MIPTDAIVDAVARSADAWLDTTTPWRPESLTALAVSTGMPERLVDRALRNAFEPLRHDPLKEYLGAELRPFLEVATDRPLLTIIPGNVFTAWLPVAVTGLLMGFRVWLKPSTRETVFPRLWKESVVRMEPSLAGHLELVAWDPRLLQDAASVVGFGCDETLEAIASQVPAGHVFVRYGSKLSVAVIGAESLEPPAFDSTLERLVSDAELFKLEGCLSPQVVYVEGTDDRLQAAALARLEKAPVFGYWSSPAELRRYLSRWGDSLSCVGVAAHPVRAAELVTMLDLSPAVRVCPLGEMQRPALEWRNGGVFLPEALIANAPRGA